MAKCACNHHFHRPTAKVIAKQFYRKLKNHIWIARQWRCTRCGKTWYRSAGLIEK